MTSVYLLSEASCEPFSVGSSLVLFDAFLSAVSTEVFF